MGMKLVVSVAVVVAASTAALAGRANRPNMARLASAAPGELVAASSADFQAALDVVEPGQTIVLGAGHVYRGPFRLPKKNGDGWITIRTSSLPLQFIPPGRRVQPDNARNMPTLTASEGSVIIADPGAHDYRFIGLEIAPEPGVYLENVVDLGTGATTADAVPHDFDFEQCYIHGDPTAGARRGIALNSANTTIANSYFSDFKEVGADSQAICGWNGPGPFTITNNYLEGAGENVMFGGADPTLANLVPSNITIRGNHFAKPLSWRQDPQHPTPPHWSVKNLLELKNAEHVVIDGNVLEDNWPDGQVGFAILFTPRNQDGGSPWSTVQDVTFSDNIVEHVAAGVDILGTDDIQKSQPLSNVRITNNLFVDVGGSWGFGRLFELLNGTTNVTIAHNTGLQTETPVFTGDTTPHTGFVFQNNIVPHNEYGFIGSGTGPDTPSIDRYLPGAVISGNVIVGGSASSYPPGNFFPATLAAVGFAKPSALDYRLTLGSLYRGKGTDGKDPGVDMTALDKATKNAVDEPAETSAATPAPAGTMALLVVTIAFWGAIVLVAYTYAGYPALVWLLARLRRKPVHTAPHEPFVTLLVVAYNEAAQIAGRIENLIAQDYPVDRREIVVVSDGSTDDTAARARRVNPGVVVIDRPERRGKAAVFDDVFLRLRGDIVVLADARQRFAPGAVRALVAHFADPRVGAVSGELILARNARAEAGSQGVEVYWDYEKRLRWWESLVDSTIGVTGAIAAVRRCLMPHIPPDTIADDVLVPLRIARFGFRVTFEPRARAYDRLSVVDRDELGRKARTLAGLFQLFSRERWLLVPWRNRLWLQTVSHKGLRLILPVLFAIVVGANLALLDQPFYRITFAAEIAFAALAIVARLSPRLRQRARWLVLPHAVLFLAWATLVGFARFAAGRQRATWERTPSSRVPVPSGR